jgi:hypothetical protein
MPPTQEALPESAQDAWETAPSLETWGRAAGTLSDGDPDEHILRGLE